MKIRKVKIQSFGNMHDESFDLNDRLNVFYGPNEAGKSTLRSFITTTLFPRSGLKYPAQKKSDNGSIDAELSDGSLKTYKKDGKGSNSDAPALCGIDDKEYVSIYSMSPADLRDMKTIEKGGIRNRFLTIPGGADLPNAYESLDNERTELLPEKRRSASCITARLIQAEKNAKKRVIDLKNRESGDAHYAELISRREQLTEDRTKLEEEVRAKDQIRTESHKADALADNIKKIQELEAREKELAYSEKVDEGALKKLDDDVEFYKKISDKEHDDAKTIASELGGFDYKTILRRKKDIVYLDKNSLTYEQEKRALQQPQPQPQQPQPAPSTVTYEKRGNPALIAAGFLVTIIGIAVMALANVIAGIAVAVIGAALAVFGFTKSKTVTVSADTAGSSSTPAPSPAVQQKSELVEHMDKLLAGIISETGMVSNGFQADVQKLAELVISAEKYHDAANKMESADKDLQNAEGRVESFLEGFGGREKFEKAVKDKSELSGVRASLSTLRESTQLIPTQDVDSQTADEDYEAMLKNLRSVENTLGNVNQAIDGILKDTEVESAITDWNNAESAAYRGALRWASLTLERMLLDRASAEAYENHRPDVLSKADTYLDLMTCGRYRMNTDPRITDIAVIDTETGDSKTAGEWSTGLEDQVKLALKLAVSLSLSKERPPVILDDILLTSDSDRKKGACEAISSLSEDIQVLYFTCDKETRDYMEQVGANIISL